MPNQVSDILKSKAVVWLAPAGEALPDETSVAAGGAWGGNWVQAGFTKEPLTLNIETEKADLMVEQYLTAVDRKITKKSATAETVLAEATALNLDYASGQDGTNVTTTAAGASQVGFEELVLTADGPCLTKWIVGFEGSLCDEDDGELPVRMFFTRATITFNGELKFSQLDDDYVGIPLSVEALADVSASGKFFQWQRVTAAATS